MRSFTHVTYYLFLPVFLVLCDGDILTRELYASAPQLVTLAGYPVEKHFANTDDGYILQIIRIPHGRLPAQKEHAERAHSRKKKAVVLVHGLIGSCDNFIIMGPNRSLAYLLADAGYDVWLANLRGNYYTSHRKFTRKDAAFWDYSFHEHGLYDAPAFIDRILKVTGVPKLLYIGHSMGCTTFLTMLALQPRYNNKLVAFVGLAAAGYMDNMKMFSNFMVNTVDLPTVLRKRGIHSITIPRNILEFVFDTYCTARQAQTDICIRMVFSFLGEDYEQHDWELSKSIIIRMQPTSLKQMYHFAKIALTGIFTIWDGGLSKPGVPYNLSNIRTPVSLWYGENDLLTEKSQILRLAKELNETGALYSVQSVAWPKFNHVDFIYAKDIRVLLNIPLLQHVKDIFDKFYKK